MRNSLIVLFLFISFTISGATYYIDPAGNNSNSGSGSAPWKTLAYACSKATAAGDIIHVNAGTYLETTQCVLAVGVSIEGVGATSIIKSHYVGGSDMNSALIMLSGGTNSGQHISGIKLDGDALTGDKAIVVYNRSNVSIYNCTIVDFATQGIRFWGSGNCTGNSIHDCSILNCSWANGSDRQAAVPIAYQTGFLLYNNTLNNNLRADGTNGIGLKIWDAVYALKIYNNYFTSPSVCTGGNNYPFAIESWNSAKLCGYGMEIYGNTFKGQVDFGAGVTKGSYAYGVDFHNNICGFEVADIPSDPSKESKIALQFEEIVSDVIIRNNLFKNIDRQVYFCSNGTSGSFDNIKVYNNIFQNIYYNWQAQNTLAGYKAHGVGIIFGGSAFTYVRNIYIWNNDFIAYSGGPGAGEVGVFLPTTGNNSNVNIQNNIFKGFATAPISADAQSAGGTLATLVIQKNVLYGNGNSNNLSTTGFTPTSLTNDGGIKSDPLFVSSTDFHLQATSPAIGKGMTLAGLTTDYEGKTLNIPPSIGAYESGSTAVIPAAIPVYQNSVVANATPSLVEMTYNLTLANIVPAITAFKVLINSVAATVNTIAVSGTKVQLTLASGIKYGDVVTVSYTKPVTNPLQTATGGQPISITAQTIINNVINPVKDATPGVITMTISPNHIHRIINIILQYSSTYSILDPAMSPQILRIFNTSGKLLIEKLLVTGVANIKMPINLRSGIYSVLVFSGGLQLASQKIIVY